jgi:alpha-ketoglutarate-dependent taurine dioxygenase
MSTEALDWLQQQPDYNNVLRVTSDSEFDAFEFVETVQFGDMGYEIIPSSDGLVSIVQDNQMTQAVDRSQQSSSFDYHTDGFYLNQPPALFLLSCENAGSQGAQTGFVNTKEALKSISEHLPILRGLELIYIAKDLQRYRRPLIEEHPVDGQSITNLVTRGYVEPIVSEETLADLSDIREVSCAMSALFSAIKESVSYVHTWRDGDLVIADNHTFLHARLTNAPDSDRELHRIWLQSAEN